MHTSDKSSAAAGTLHPLPHHRRHQVNLRLERWHRRCVHTVFATLFCSGAAWLVLHYFLRPASQFGEGVHPLEPWSMKLHGGAAMAALFFTGSLLNAHIRRAIKSGRNLVTGWSVIASVLLLVISGFGLYYIASDSDRALWSLAHWLPGLLFGPLLIAHVIWGRRSRQ